MKGRYINVDESIIEVRRICKRNLKSGGTEKAESTVLVFESKFENFVMG